MPQYFLTTYDQSGSNGDFVTINLSIVCTAPFDRNFINIIGEFLDDLNKQDDNSLMPVRRRISNSEKDSIPLSKENALCDIPVSLKKITSAFDRLEP